MKIDNRLPQFDKEAALIAVTSEHAAKFYLAHEGEMKELDIFHVLQPKYTDREGFFRKTTGKKELGSGSIYEPRKDYLMVRFLHKLKKEVKNIRETHPFDSIYLFAPAYMAKEIFAVLPADICDTVKLKITGNFVDASPYELLRKIKEEIKKAVSLRKLPPLEEEARKLIGRISNI
jgi:hypothetical protein